jgi:Bifunctional DNA primase/polymerase, N-terminal
MEDQAIELYEKGYSLVPLIPGTKRPFMDNWPEFELLPNDIKRFFQTDHNIGTKTGKPSNLVAVDVDKKDAAREFYRKHQSILKTVVETRKGAHFWFRHPGGEIGNGKHKYGDLRSDGGQVVSPNSEVGGWKYRYVEGHELVRPEELPLFDFSLVEAVAAKTHLTRELVTNVEAYLSKIESIQGQYGSRGLMRAIYVCRDAGLSQAETMIRLVRWNETNSLPAWSDNELLRAVSNAYKEQSC